MSAREEVRAWLKGQGFDQQADALVDAGFDSMKMLSEISDDDWQQTLDGIGVSFPTLRKKAFMNHVRKAKKEALEDEEENEERAPPAATLEPPKKNVHYLFVGNPGAGKSTLLNALAKETEAVFEAGFSPGSGKTTHMQKHEAPDGSVYLDTPGLEDPKIRKQAAAEICRGLRHDGFFRIFFVITLESGRVRPADATTMKLVLEAAPQIGCSYGVIINKVTQAAITKLRGDGDQIALIKASLFADMPNPTPYIMFCPFDEDLEDADNVVAQLPQELLVFIYGMLPAQISADKVHDIADSEYDAVTEKLQAAMEAMRNDSDALHKQLAIQQASLDKQRQDLEKSIREKRDREEALMEEIERATEEGQRHRLELQRTKLSREIEEFQTGLNIFNGAFDKIEAGHVALTALGLFIGGAISLFTGGTAAPLIFAAAGVASVGALKMTPPSP